MQHTHANAHAHAHAHAHAYHYPLMILWKMPVKDVTAATAALFFGFVIYNIPHIALRLLFRFLSIFWGYQYYAGSAEARGVQSGNVLPPRRALVWIHVSPYCRDVHLMTFSSGWWWDQCGTTYFEMWKWRQRHPQIQTQKQSLVLIGRQQQLRSKNSCESVRR